MENKIFEENLAKLKKLREFEEKAKAEKENAIEMLPIVQELKAIQFSKIKLENEIRELAVNRFKETGEKKFGQVGIRVTTKYEYEESEALNWAKQHNLCLSLDKVAFKKQLKVQPLEFVQAIETPIATIPTEIKG